MRCISLPISLNKRKETCATQFRMSTTPRRKGVKLFSRVWIRKIHLSPAFLKFLVPFFASWCGAYVGFGISVELLEIQTQFPQFDGVRRTTMLLIIPAIEIHAEHCVRKVLGVDGVSYSDDPVQMVKLLRVENTKSLHVTDVDGALCGRPMNAETIRQMVKAVDIPIELGGGFRTFDDVCNAIELGVYRVLISTMIIENPDDAKRSLDKFGASKVVVGIDAIDGLAATHGWAQTSGLTPMSVALNAKALGFRRIVYTDINLHKKLEGPNLDALRELAELTGMRITSAGGIRGLDDLLKVQELEKFGVDSVIIGRALYENKFSCQAIWRMCEKENYPYTAKVQL